MEIAKKSDNKTIKNICKGVAVAFFATTVMLIVFAILLTYTEIKENTMDTVIIIITAVSILIGSSIGNLKIKKNGLLNGAIIGGSYICIIYFISSILNWRFSLNLQSIIMIAVGMIFGIFGGIIGVNKS